MTLRFSFESKPVLSALVLLSETMSMTKRYFTSAHRAPMRRLFVAR